MNAASELIKKKLKIFFRQITAVRKNDELFKFFWTSANFFQSSKILYFVIIIVNSIETCIEEIQTHFQVNWLKKTGEIRSKFQKNVVSRKKNFD